MSTTRRCVAIVIPSLMLLELAGCGSGIPPRSAALDPSNANGPESPPFNEGPALSGPEGAETASGRPSSAEGSEQHAGHSHAPGNAEAMPASSAAAATQAGSSDQSATYTCPMHPEVKSTQPGKCPKCGMELVPQGKQGGPAPAPIPAVDSAAPKTAKNKEAPKAMAYTCPMHPEVVSAQPGKCPKCGMNLVPKKADQ